MLSAGVLGALVGLALAPAHLTATLSGPHHVTGHVDYEYDMGHGRHLDVEIRHVTPGAHLTVSVRGVRVGVLVANGHGEADRDLSSQMNCQAGNQVRVVQGRHLVAMGAFTSSHHAASPGHPDD